MGIIEDILSELKGETNEQGLPPGFRFHPTDEELITFYLASKVFSGTFCGVQIAEIDLNRCEPWELPDVAKMGKNEWYFFSLRDRKYPTGLRTNRATKAGYWKATGRDRGVYSATSGELLGMKKTLVFYKERAPHGVKTDWVMHEYRLDGYFSYSHPCKDDWVICRIFHRLREKTSSSFKLQSHPTKGPFPSLLEETALNPEGSESNSRHSFVNHHHQDGDLKMSPSQDIFQLPCNFSINALQPCFLPTHVTITPPIENSNEYTAPMHCKTEFDSPYSLQLMHDTNQQWINHEIQPDIFSGLDCGVMEYPPVVQAHVPEMSTSWHTDLV